jgi:uncharacterized NAD(P)/FAD-binding protein YdhS
MTTIAIIGAGFSGTLLSLHLLRCCPPTTKLLLIERNSQFGRGLAYSTGNPSHILNVPAGRMSAFHDRPDDFVTWLRGQPDGESIGPQGFAPRRLFGAYIRALLNEEIKHTGRDRLELIKGNVVGLDRTVDPLLLTLEGGDTIRADLAVLANGNFPPGAIPVANPSFYDTKFYRADPWACDVLTGLEPDAPVVLLGTGLTMVDMTISLLDQQHKGSIYALSRRGLVPMRHASVPPPVLEPAPYPTTVLAMTRHLRRRARAAIAQGSGWQPVIDALRPLTVDIWQQMTLPERRRFLRHCRAWWDVHRHRMGAQVGDRIDAARASGQLRIVPGRVRDYVVNGDRVEVTYRPRGLETLATITAARVINCTGVGLDYDRIADPLVRSLLQTGTIRPDALRLGLDVTGNCALINRDGAVSRRLFAVGPVTKGAFWEMVAVPDLRRQTVRIAEHLAGLVKA